MPFFISFSVFLLSLFFSSCLCSSLSLTLVCSTVTKHQCYLNGDINSCMTCTKKDRSKAFLNAFSRSNTFTFIQEPNHKCIVKTCRVITMTNLEEYSKLQYHNEPLLRQCVVSLMDTSLSTTPTFSKLIFAVVPLMSFSLMPSPQTENHVDE